MPLVTKQNNVNSARQQLIQSFNNYQVLFEKYQKTISIRKQAKQTAYLNGLELTVRNVLEPYVEKDVLVTDPGTISIRVMFFAQDPSLTVVLACHIIPDTPDDYQNIVDQLQNQIDTGLVTVDRLKPIHHSVTFDRDVLIFFELIGRYMINQPAILNEFIDVALIVNSRRFSVPHHQLISLIMNQTPLLANELKFHQMFQHYKRDVIYETCFDFIQSLIQSLIQTLIRYI